MANNYKYNLHLEALRGIAAILVVCTHLAASASYLKFKNNYIVQIIGAWGTEAVIIFFVLSGIVIHASFEKTHRSNFSFLINRIIRLHPILIISIIFTVLIEKFALHHTISGWQIVGNIIPVSTLSASLAPVYFQSNPVIWSLSFEMFFYIVFAIGGIYNHKLNWAFIKIWFILSIISIVGYYQVHSIPIINYLLQMMAFSCIWLVGLFIWSIKNNYSITFFTAAFSLCCLPLISRLHLTTNYYDPIKYLFFTIASIPFFIYLCRLNSNSLSFNKDARWQIINFCLFIVACFLMLNDNSYTNTSKLIYITLPLLAFVFYSSFAKKIITKFYYKCILYPFSYIGKLSYSIYLIHFPILVIVVLLPFSMLLKLVLALGSIFSISILLEIYFQPFIKKLFKRLTA